MKKYLLFSVWVMSTLAIQAQITDPVATEVWEPEPRIVSAPPAMAPPSDAMVLFDGSDTHQWAKLSDSAPIAWKNENGVLTVLPGTGDIVSRQRFGDCQLHLEFRSPAVVKGEGQGRGNSGVFLQQQYEIQILDSYQNRTYSNGQAGAIYKQHPPLVNASRPPGEWQTYDIIFTAPRFNQDGMKIAPAYVTVLHNGVLIQNHSEIKGTTEYIGLPQNKAHGPLPIQLQDHSNPVSYRNIWIREL